MALPFILHESLEDRALKLLRASYEFRHRLARKEYTNTLGFTPLCVVDSFCAEIYHPMKKMILFEPSETLQDHYAFGILTNCLCVDEVMLQGIIDETKKKCMGVQCARCNAMQCGRLFLVQHVLRRDSRLVHRTF